MISQRAELPIVTFSVRVYQALLVAYPTRFQQEYGSEMTQVFQDYCLRTVRQGGTNGMLKLWMVTLLDLLQSVVSEHAQKEVQMKKEMNPEDIRMAGGALMWGGLTFAMSLLLLLMGDSTGNLTNPFYPLSGLLLFLSIPLLVVGLLGVRNRYGDKVGGFGKNILLMGAILGPLTTLIGLVGSLTHLFLTDDSNWFLLMIGPAVLLACLAAFGIVALYKKPLPRWNIVPVIAGGCYPIIIVFIIVTSNTINWKENLGVLAIIVTLQGIALAALGYILKSDVSQETTAMLDQW